MTKYEDENMRINQVVEAFPYSKATIYRYVKEGFIKSYKITKGVTIYKRSELEDFFSGKKATN